MTQARSASDGTIPSLALRACVTPNRAEYNGVPGPNDDATITNQGAKGGPIISANEKAQASTITDNNGLPLIIQTQGSLELTGNSKQSSLWNADLIVNGVMEADDPNNTGNKVFWTGGNIEEELLVRSLLKTSVPLAKMDLHGLMALQPKIASGESEAKDHLKHIREMHEFEKSAVQNMRENYERLKERKPHKPVLARTYEHLKEQLPKWERDLRKFPQREAKAMQAIKDWRKLSRIVAATILERKQSGDAQGPRKK